MAVQSLWTGTVSFGLVAIPVRLVTAVRSRRIAFHWLHEVDHARLRRQMVCPREGVAIHPEHIVRGFEIEPETYVLVRQDELDALEPSRSRTIEIQSFVDLDSIDPVYYDRPYYLAPGEGAEKPYALLVRALAEKGRGGTTLFVLHARQAPALVREIDGVLGLILLHYDSERVRIDESRIQSKAGSKDVDRLAAEIKRTLGRFQPEKTHKDHRRDKLAARLREKARRGTFFQAPSQPESAEDQFEPEDLIATLERSLHQDTKESE